MTSHWPTGLSLWLWQVARDPATGVIIPDATRFPSGMRAIADYVHSIGLKFGLYTARGSGTCQGRPGR